MNAQEQHQRELAREGNVILNRLTVDEMRDNVERCKEGLADLRDWFWDAAEYDSPEWCRAQSDLCDRAVAALTALSSEDATRPTLISDSASTCMRCGNRSVVAHGGGFRCRDCGKDEMRPTGDKE